MPDTQVLIVGAGPTGLVLALCLTRLGIRIIDKVAEPGTPSMTGFDPLINLRDT